MNWFKMAQTLSDKKKKKKECILSYKERGPKQASRHNSNAKVAKILIGVEVALVQFFAPRMDQYCIINRGSIWA